MRSLGSFHRRRIRQRRNRAARQRRLLLETLEQRHLLATITVGPTGDFTTIQQAIDQAVGNVDANDVIEIDPNNGIPYAENLDLANGGNPGGGSLQIRGQGGVAIIAPPNGIALSNSAQFDADVTLASLKFGPSAVPLSMRQGLALDTYSGNLLIDNVEFNGIDQAIELGNVGGTTTMKNNIFTQINQAAIAVQNSDATFSVSNNVFNQVGAGIILMTNPSATFSFDKLTLTTNNGPAFVAQNSGTVNVLADDSIVNATGGPALVLRDTRGQTNGVAGWNFASLQSTTSNIDGIVLEGLADSFTAQGTVVENPGGAGILATNSPGVNVDFGVTNVSDSDTSASDGIVLNNNAAANFTFSSIDVSASDGRGLVTNNSNLRIRGVNNTIEATGGAALELTGSSLTNPDGGKVTFDSVTSTGSPTEGIRLDSVSGSLQISDGSLVTATGSSVRIAGGDVHLDFAASVTHSKNSPAVAIGGGHSGVVNFGVKTIGVSSGSGLQFNDADGDYHFNSTVTLNGGDAGIDILNNSSGTFTFASLTQITNPSGAGIRIDGSTPSVTFDGTIQNNTDHGIHLSNSGGSFTFGGTLNENGSKGLLFDVVGGTVNVGGTTTISNATEAGIRIRNSDGNLTFTAPLVKDSVAGIDILGGTGTFTFDSLDAQNNALATDTAGIVRATSPSVTGAGIDIKAGAGVQLSGDVTSFGDQRFQSPVTLIGNTTFTFPNILFNSKLNSDTTARNATFNSSNSGTTTFEGLVGDSSPLNNVSVNADGQTDLNAPIFTVAGQLLIFNPVILTDDVVLTFGNLAKFDKTVNATGIGGQSLRVESTNGAVQFGDTIGGTTPLKELIVSTGGANATVPRAHTSQAAGGSGNQNYDLSGPGSNGTMNIASDFTTGGGDFQLKGSVVSSTIAGAGFNTAGGNFGIDGPVNPTTNGEQTIKIEVGSGDATIGPFGTTNPWGQVIVEGTGNLELHGATTTPDGGKTGDQIFEGATIKIFDPFASNGGGITFDGNTVIGGDSTVDTQGGNATFGGKTDAMNPGGQGLNVQTGGGDVFFDDTIGGNTPLEDIFVGTNGADANIPRAHTSQAGGGSGNQNYDLSGPGGNGRMNIASDFTTGGGDFQLKGSVVSSTIAGAGFNTAGGNFGIDGPINPTTNGEQTIKIEVGSGDATIGPFGTTNPWGQVIVEGTGNLELHGATTTPDGGKTGNQVFEGATIKIFDPFASNGGGITFDGNTVVEGDTTIGTGVGAGILFEETVTQTNGTLRLGGDTRFKNDIVIQGGTFATEPAPFTILFEPGKTLRLRGDASVDVGGAPTDLLELRSATDGQPWLLDANTTGGVDFRNIDVADSDASAGTPIEPVQAIDSGNNLNWSFGAVVIVGVGGSPTFDARLIVNNVIVTRFDATQDALVVSTPNQPLDVFLGAALDRHTAVIPKSLIDGETFTFLTGGGNDELVVVHDTPIPIPFVLQAGEGTDTLRVQGNSAPSSPLTFTPGRVTFQGQPIDFDGTEAQFLAGFESATVNLPAAANSVELGTTANNQIQVTGTFGASMLGNWTLENIPRFVIQGAEDRDILTTEIDSVLVPDLKIEFHGNGGTDEHQILGGLDSDAYKLFLRQLAEVTEVLINNTVTTEITGVESLKVLGGGGSDRLDVELPVLLGDPIVLPTVGFDGQEDDDTLGVWGTAERDEIKAFLKNIEEVTRVIGKQLAEIESQNTEKIEVRGMGGNDQLDIELPDVLGPPIVLPTVDYDGQEGDDDGLGIWGTNERDELKMFLKQVAEATRVLTEHNGAIDSINNERIEVRGMQGNDQLDIELPDILGPPIILPTVDYDGQEGDDDGLGIWGTNERDELKMFLKQVAEATRVLTEHTGAIDSTNNERIEVRGMQGNDQLDIELPDILGPPIILPTVDYDGQEGDDDGLGIWGTNEADEIKIFLKQIAEATRVLTEHTGAIDSTNNERIEVRGMKGNDQLDIELPDILGPPIILPTVDYDGQEGDDDGLGIWGTNERDELKLFLKQVAEATRILTEHTGAIDSTNNERIEVRGMGGNDHLELQLPALLVGAPIILPTLDFDGQEDDDCLEILGTAENEAIQVRLRGLLAATEILVQQNDIIRSMNTECNILRAQGGDDQLRVIVEELANHLRQIDFHGDAGSDRIDLEGTPGGGINRIQHRFDNANDGQIDVDGNLFNYTGLEPIGDLLQADIRVFEFADANDVITVDTGQAISDGVTRVSSEGTSETVDFRNPASQLTILSMGGDDRVTINEVDGGVPGQADQFDIAIDGGEGQNELFGDSATPLDFTGGPNDDTFRVGVAGFKSIAGQAGRDQLLLDADGVTLDLSTVDDTRFTGIEVIDIRGKNAASVAGNTLQLNAGEVLAASDSTDTLTVLADTNDTVMLSDVWKFAQSEVIDGLFYRTFASGNARLQIRGPRDWQNPALRHDVNGDGEIVSLDALRIINQINQPTVLGTNGVLQDAATVDPTDFKFYDVDGDGFGTSSDVRQIINLLNGVPSGEGEHSQAAFVPSNLTSVWFVTPVERLSKELRVPTLTTDAAAATHIAHDATQNLPPVAGLKPGNVDRALAGLFGAPSELGSDELLEQLATDLLDVTISRRHEVI